MQALLKFTFGFILILIIFSFIFIHQRRLLLPFLNALFFIYFYKKPLFFNQFDLILYSHF